MRKKEGSQIHLSSLLCETGQLGPSNSLNKGLAIVTTLHNSWSTTHFAVDGTGAPGVAHKQKPHMTCDS